MPGPWRHGSFQARGDSFVATSSRRRTASRSSARCRERRRAAPRSWASPSLLSLYYFSWGCVGQLVLASSGPTRQRSRRLAQGLAPAVRGRIISQGIRKARAASRSFLCQPDTTSRARKGLGDGGVRGAPHARRGPRRRLFYRPHGPRRGVVARARPHRRALRLPLTHAIVESLRCSVHQSVSAF